MKEENIQIKKSYNPFKMWGSWVGLVLYPIIIAITNLSGLWTRYDWMKYFLYPLSPLEFLMGLSGCVGEECWGVGIIVIILSSLIIGFLLGWGIHSLVRRLKK